MNFGGGYVNGGVTIYKSGIISIRDSFRIYETNGSSTDQFIRVKAPDSLSGSSHGQPERVLTLPDVAADTLVGKTTADTLTNKTLTSPTINSATLTGNFSGGITFDNELYLKDSFSSYSGNLIFYHPNDTTFTRLFGSYYNTNNTTGYLALPQGSSIHSLSLIHI